MNDTQTLTPTPRRRGRPPGRRKNRSALLENLKHRIAHEVSVAIHASGMTGPQIAELLGRSNAAYECNSDTAAKRKTAVRASEITALRSGNMTSIGPDVLFTLADKLGCPTAVKLRGLL